MQSAKLMCLRRIYSGRFVKRPYNGCRKCLYICAAGTCRGGACSARRNAKRRMQNAELMSDFVTFIAAHRGRMRPTVAVKHYGRVVGVGAYDDP